MRFLLPLGLFIVLVAFLAIGLTLDPREVPSPLIGKPAPNFALPLLAEPAAKFSPADMKGKVWMLNVWASWCVPCREEHPVLVEYSKTGNVPLYGLSYKDQTDAAQRWLKQLGNPYQAVAFDTDGRTAIDWGVYGAPETYLVDGQGRIIYKFISPITQQVWDREFMPRIAAARRGGA